MSADKDKDPHGRYCIKYVAFHPGYRPDKLPTLRQYVVGKRNMELTRAALRGAGCTVIQVVRTNWFT
jgi:hypothetical protein